MFHCGVVRPLLFAVAVLAPSTTPAVTPPARARPVVQWRGSGGWGLESAYQRLYDPVRTVSLRGTLVGLALIRPAPGMKPGVAVLMDTEDQGRVVVHLGPRWYLEQQDLRLRERQPVEVVGARVTRDHATFVMAAEVKIGARVLKLRDGLGLPLWSWSRRPQPPTAEE